MKKLIQVLWKIFLFSFPFSLHFVLYEKASYRFGNFNPWVTGFLFLPEVLLGLIFILWFVDKIRRKSLNKLKWPGVGLILVKLFILNAGIVILFSGDIFMFFFLAIHIFAGYIVYILIKEEVVPHDLTIKWLLYGASFQIVIAYFQTRLNGSVGLPVLGEPDIGISTMNVAKTNLADGTKVIRPYGTFLHPNILGAYLMVILFVALPYLKRAALPFWLIIITAGIYLTGSQAAQLSTVAVFGIFFLFGILKKPTYKRILSMGILSIIIFLNTWLFINSAVLQFRNSSISERLEQNAISLNMFLHNIWGVGVNNFTLDMETFAVDKLMPWEFQPVHNSYFLILNETGMQGFMLLIMLIAFILYRYWKENHEYSLKDKARILPFISILIIASFDHLLWTSYIGMILIGLVIAETTRTV